MRLVLLVSSAAALGAPALSGQQAAPYAGYGDRDIKALSAEQVRQLEAGEGMGLALAAELNRYPGPRHVLELRDSLALTPAQARDIEAIARGMQQRARALGAGLIERERQLDRLFAGGSADSAAVRSLTDEIGRLGGQLRYAHLAAHLSVTRLLDPAQRRRYQELRGYAGHGAGGHQH